MADEPESLVLRLLQEIRADVAEIKTDHGRRLVAIEEALRLQGIRLDTYSENFHDIIRLLRDMATAADLRELAVRVDALENRRQ